MIQLILSEQRWFRFSAFTAFYFAQGVPIGLLAIAVPKWLDVGVAEIAVYQATISLPWALKLIAGPFMDRFTFLSMGFRRPWVLAAQGGLTLSLLGLVFISEPTAADLGPLIAVAFVINCFAATQDVAVDGMSIDILPIEERGRANALMAFGQVAGFAAFGALAGTLLSVIGLAATAMICSATVAVIFGLVAVMRERPGEKVMPWSVGQATDGRLKNQSITHIFRDLVRVLLLPMSLLLTAVEFLNRVRDGIAVSVFPVFADQVLELSDAVYASYFGIFSFGAALAGAACGPLIDRLGTKRFLLIGLLGSASCHLFFGIATGSWQNLTFVASLYFVMQIFSQFIFVAIIAMYMNLCWTKVSATQFSVYMAISNLSRSAGAAMLAVIAGSLSFATEFLLMGGLLLASTLCLAFFSLEKHQARLDSLDQDTADPAIGSTLTRNASSVR